MPGPLYSLDGKSREEIAGWLRQALLGKVAVPREYPGQPLPGAISSSAPALEDQARRDLSAAAIQLLAEIRGGKPKHTYVTHLLRLITDLDLRSSAIPILRELAADIPALGKRIGWESSSDVLFALLNLRDLQDPDYWLSRWSYNKRCFSPVTLSALFDLDATRALEFLPDLPNSEDFGDLAALNLDHCADALEGPARGRFREKIAEVAKRCDSRIRRAIKTWLSETETRPESKGDLALLWEALGNKQEKSPAKLCVL